MMERYKKFMDTPEMLVLVALVGIGASAYSLVSMVLAYLALEANVSDATNALSNWQLKPLVDVQALTPAYTTLGNYECPSSHPELLSGLNFGAIEAAPCACPSGAFAKVFDDGPYTMYSTVESCNGTQLDAGCKNDPGMDFGYLPLWKQGLAICGKRGGEALISGTSPVKSRPIPSATGECAQGYKLCGDVNSLSQSFCFPNSEPLCPYTQLFSVAKADFNSSSYPNATLISSGDQWLVWSRNAGRLPVVDFTMGFKTLCIGEQDAYSYGGTTGNLQGKLDVDTSCLGGRPTDDRYVALATATQREVLSSNFDNARGYCDSAGRSTPGLSTLDGSCRTDDEICASVTSRSKCDKLTSYENGDPDAGDISMLYRLQVAWSRTCPVPIDDVVANIGPLLEIMSFTFIVLIINVSSNAITIFLEGNFVVNKCRGDSPCCPLTGKDEESLILFCKTAVGLFVKLARLVPIALLAFQTFAVREFWSNVADLSCSDAVTATTMSLLSDKFAFAFASYAGSLVSDTLSVLISVGGFIRRNCCKSSDD